MCDMNGIPRTGDDEDTNLVALGEELVELHAQLNDCFARLLGLRQSRGDAARRHLAAVPHPEAS